MYQGQGLQETASFHQLNQGVQEENFQVSHLRAHNCNEIYQSYWLTHSLLKKINICRVYKNSKHLQDSHILVYPFACIFCRIERASTAIHATISIDMLFIENKLLPFLFSSQTHKFVCKYFLGEELDTYDWFEDFHTSHKLGPSMSITYKSKYNIWFNIRATM